MRRDLETAVIITAKDAAATVAKAVRSALAQPRVREVVVVDDGSGDDTAAVARAADDGARRLRVIRLQTNHGPAHGRNVALDASTAPLVCILDADDFMAAGRLDRLYARGGEGWDLLADDLLICDAGEQTRVIDRLLPERFRTPHDLTLSEFAIGNLPTRPARRELGFLHPVMRRSFLERHAIRYDDGLRLGEDVVLYARCLLAGARFRVVEACGYCAVQYPGSLSARHRTEDIENLNRALIELEAEAKALGRDVGALPRYTRWTQRNLALRRALDFKRRNGMRGVMSALSADPSSVPYILRTVAGWKFAALQKQAT